MSNNNAASIQSQAQKVRSAYAKTGSLNPEYEQEFAKLSDMKKLCMADQFRKDRGLHAKAKTPYCPDR